MRQTFRSRRLALLLPRRLALLLALVAAAPLAAQTEAILTPSAPAQNDRFGWDTDVDGARLLVGVPFDDAGVGAGVVYERTGGVWVEAARLTPPAGARGAGLSVALEGTRAVLGAYGANGAEGAAYVFEESGGTWSLAATLAPPASAASRAFGFDVALAGRRIVVGAPQEALGDGAVYVFDESGGAWTQTARLVPAAPVARAFFGLSVATDGAAVVAGAPAPYASAPASAAHVFTATGSAWAEAVVPGASAGDLFGADVAVEGARLVVGAPGWQGREGAAFVFEDGASGWAQTARLDGGAAYPSRQLGHRVALDGARLAVAEIGTSSGPDRGRALVYDLAGGAWTVAADLQASDGDPADQFGYGLALDGSQVAVGAPFKASGAPSAGGAYVFDLAASPPPVLLADQALTVGQAAVFVGDAHANGALTLNRQPSGFSGSYVGDLTAVGDLTVERFNAVDGDVTAGGALALDPRASVTGTATGNAPVAPVALPAVASVTPGTQNVTVDNGAQVTLAPGAYRTVRVESGNGLTLTAGTYELDRLVLRPSTTLTLDVSAGPITVQARTRLIVGSDVILKVAGAGGPDLALSDRVTIRTAQTANLVLGNRSFLVGTIEAPLALVQLRADATLVGALAGREIAVANRTSLWAHGAPVAPPASASATEPLGAAPEAEGLALAAAPNPVRGAAAVTFAVPEAGPVRLAAYDALGREVAVLAEGRVEAGTHRAALDAAGLPAGVYLLRLTTPAGAVTRPLTRVR